MFRSLGLSTSQAKASVPGKVYKIAADSLHTSKPTHWLTSRFHFSFADWMYPDPEMNNYGPLRVLNDDIVTARNGFGRHPHRDAEIFSYVVDGELSHRDSMGNQEALGRGSVQYLSAGTGITHSEMNEGDVPVRFLQIWISPDRRGHTPQYGSEQYEKEDRHNRLLHVLGGTGPVPGWAAISDASAIKLHQDCNVFVSESDAGKSFTVDVGAGRQLYLVCIEGSLTINDVSLAHGDAAKVKAEAGASLPLTIAAGDKGAHFLAIDMVQL